ncbi:response regulator transcription factor [Streptomyces sp. LBUM 1476]|nr:response regulator transcription factor [Streptomyces sp. LBUM 1476]MBZ3910656.1 response regulator transcription factor [Streptomyces acidiscabies]
MANVESRLVEEPHEIRASDDVVLFYGPGPARELERFSAEGGLPPVAVLAYWLDWQDVRQALDHGAGSYLLETVHVSRWLPWMLLWTARGGSCLDPVIAAEPGKVVGRVGAQEHGFRTLSERERQVMELLAAGQGVRDIARGMFLTEKTVRNYLSRIYAKLEVRGRSEAILRWLGHLGGTTCGETRKPDGRGTDHVSEVTSSRHIVSRRAGRGGPATGPTPAVPYVS